MEPVPNPIAWARVHEAALQRPGTRTYRAVAEAYGVTAAEVCKYVWLVRGLAPDLVKAVEKEDDPRRLRRLSLRRLGAVARVANHSVQRGAVEAPLHGPRRKLSRGP